MKVRKTVQPKILCKGVYLCINLTEKPTTSGWNGLSTTGSVCLFIGGFMPFLPRASGCAACKKYRLRIMSSILRNLIQWIMTPEPVSYTHLDVYKRQGYLIQKNGYTTIWWNDGNYQYCISGAVSMEEALKLAEETGF